jgi:hypothetical protein
MLFPILGPQYYDQKDQAILSRMESFYAEAITINQSFWGEADTDTRFEVGDQTLWTDLYGNLPANRRRQFNFNRIRRVIEMVSGYQRRNRKSTICIPEINADAETADQFTKVLMYVNKTGNVLETISEAFHGALVTGMNFLHVWTDYRTDPVNGEIKVDCCPYNSYMVDPYFRKLDMSDCNGIWKRSFLTKRECISLLPESTEEILGLTGLDAGTGRDGKFQFMPESYNYGYKNLLTYDEFYYRDYRQQKLLIDSQTGDTMEWKSDDEDALRMFLEMNPTITVTKQEIPTVTLAIVVQGRVFYHGPQPQGIDSYPMVPVVGYYNPQMPYFPYRIQGMVRGLRDAQYLYNRRRIIELDILESQINSGWIYKENALVNPKDVFLNGQGRGLALKSDAQMTDVQQILPPQVPPSMIQLSELLAREVMEISGVNEELLGSAIDDKAGILSMLRQGAGLTTLQSLFDHLDLAQKAVGKIMLDIVQANWTPGKIAKILEDQQPAAQFYNKNFGKYNADVEEGLNTTTQKQMQFAQMLQLREAGVPISPVDLLEAATIQGKKKIIENSVAMQQAQMQAQQIQLQAGVQEQQARTNLAHARAQADRGLGLERVSRIQENQALAQERRAAAEKDREMALLNLVKALKEIEGVDLAHLEKLINLNQLVQSGEQSLSEEQPMMPQQAPMQQSPMQQNLEAIGQPQPMAGS